MDSNKKKDWFFRYNHILKKRFTPKQKERFIQSVSSDIFEMREDIFVTEIQYNKKEETNAKNIYVGDVRKADIIIASYYDTPANYLGPYRFFDTDGMRKQTLRLNLLTSILLFLIGILFTIFVTIPVLNNFSSINFYTILIVIFYLLFFYLLRKAASGLAKRDNLVRNNSSLLLILDLISSIKSKDVAFAFVDKGSQNMLGLEALKKSAKANSKIYYLDSIGSKQKLYSISSEPVSESIKQLDLKFDQDKRVSYIISAEIKDNKPILTKESQQIDAINQENVTIIKNIFLNW